MITSDGAKNIVNIFCDCVNSMNFLANYYFIFKISHDNTLLNLLCWAKTLPFIESKGQLISKCSFGVFKSLKKTTKII